MSDWKYLNPEPYERRRTMAATERSATNLEQLLEAQRQLVESQRLLVEAQAATEKREREMLVWTRVAGIAAVLALVVSAAAIVVTLAVG